MEVAVHASCIDGRLEQGLDRVGSGCGGGNTEEERGQVLEDEGWSTKTVHR